MPPNQTGIEICRITFGNTWTYKKMSWFKNKSLVLSTGYCLNVSNSTMAQEKSGSN